MTISAPADLPPPKAASPIDRPDARPERASTADTLAVLFQRPHRLVSRLAPRYGRGRVAWAEDITQEVFIDVLKALPPLSDLEDMEGWLYRATTNRSLNRLRRERFLALAPVRWLLGEQQPEPPPPE